VGLPGLPLVDPLKIVSELLVLIIAVVVLAILWNQRKRVLVLVTGEDRIHVTPLDCVWWTCFRCCGTCHHEWTRWLTSCSCCPNRVRGRNLVKLMGSMVGAATHSVEISNIVVGDLPFKGRGSFYLSCECAHNPPMRTSTADWKLPKLVHFPEVFTLRLRFSPLEPMVKIAVYELNIIGSEELCSVHLNAENIILWSMDSEHRTKRFAMKPASEAMQVQTPPWIVLEFDHPRNDVRDLDALAGSISTVRTATWSELDPRTGTTGVYTDMGMKPFKHKYKLIDNYGNHVMEPLEDDLWKIEAYRGAMLCVYSFASLVLMLLVFAYLTLRFYAWSCWRKYRYLTMALRVQPNTTRAFTPAMLIHISDSCAEFAAGNDLVEGKHPCRPSNKHVQAVCERLPAEQRKPTAFTGFIQRYWGQDIKGVPCNPGTCAYQHLLVKWDLPCLFLCVLAVIWVCCLFRPCIRGCIEKKKRRIMAKRAKATHPAGPQRQA